jgi:amidophosphoribosyltransferase
MCGVIGIHGSPESAQEAYQGLLLMQHRGQDAAGIIASNTNSIQIHKDNGLVDQVFNREILERLNGFTSIGHTRYSTIGNIRKEDSLPFFTNYPFGISLAHNGNIYNAKELRDDIYLRDKRYIITQNDGEILLNIIAHHLSLNEFSFESLCEATKYIMINAKGAYASLGSVLGHGLFAFRDPKGTRPLVYGKKFNGTHWIYAFASESSSLEYLEYEYIEDVKPGELIFIDNNFQLHKKEIYRSEKKTCMFEWIYFAGAQSLIDGRNVYEARIRLGEYLGEKIKNLINCHEIDVVVPVPETSRISAIRLSEIIQRPYRELLIKNRYIQRSFILNTQKSRERAVRLKLSPVKHEIVGKNVLLVDDSIVRGTTSKNIIRLIREAGAKKVFLASTCPPILNPCHYGIAFPTHKELVAYDKNYEEIKQSLSADEIFYLNIPKMIEALETNEICKQCLDGTNPPLEKIKIPYTQNEEKHAQDIPRDH